MSTIPAKPLSMELNLTLPNFTERPAAEVETQPEKAKQWLSELPILSVVETSHKIFSSLSSLNRIGLDDGVRMQLLELYSGPVNMLCLELQKSFLGLPLPLSDKHKMTAERNRRFAVEMAFGYKRIVMNALHTGKYTPGARQSPELAMPIQRAIRYLGATLLRSYQFYAHCPPGTWREIHALYKYADCLGITNIAVNDPLNDTIPNSSVGHVYKQALLVELSDPFHLPVSMMEKIHRYLDRWASLAQLSEATSADTSQCQFLIDQNSDRAAHAYSTSIQFNNPGQFRLLNTIELARVIHAQLSVLKDNRPLNPEGLERNFYDGNGQVILQRMINSWGLIPKRRFTRSVHESCDIHVAIGIDAINYWINGGREFVLSTSLVGPMPKRTNIGDTTGATPQTNDIADKHMAWELIDESAGGFSVRKNRAREESARVGDLIATRLPAHDSKWTIGIIRWIRTPSQADIEIGAQRLAPEATPLMIKIISEKNEETDFIPALLLPEIRTLKQQKTIIAHKGTYKPERILYADSGYELLKFTPTVLIESTSYLEQFQFRLLET